MSTNKITLTSAAIAAAFTFAANTAEAGSKVKCYGIADAKKNGCGAWDGSHGCAGQGKVAYSFNEWKKVSSEDCTARGGVKKADMTDAKAKEVNTHANRDGSKN